MMNDYEHDFSDEPEEFTDPVLRCDSCNVLVRRTTLHTLGSCDKCGNKRFKDVTVFDEVEQAQMIAWGFQCFVDEFQEVSNV